jgi:hypothetical protein
MSSYAFEIPGLKVSDLLGYQQQLQGACIANGSNGTAAGPELSIYPRPCTKHAAPDYTASYYSAGTTTYDKLTIKNNGGGKYVAELPKPVAAQQDGAVLLSYAGKGYATQVLGASRFDFKTLKVSERVKQATVALDVDTGLYLLDGKSKINYSESAPATDQGVSASGSARQLDSIAYSVGRSGTISEEAKDLAAGESLSVKGTYADAAWKLHPWRLVALAGLGVAVAVLAWWLWRRGRRRKSAEAAKPAAVKAVAKPVANDASAAHVSFTDPLAIAVGAVSAIAIVLLTWGLMAYSEHLESNYDEFNNVISFILAVVGYVLAVVGPLLWVSVRRHDWRPGVFGLVWLALSLVVVLLVYTLGIKPLQEVTDKPYLPAGGMELNSSGSARDLPLKAE